jgi:hypothetical protein
VCDRIPDKSQHTPGLTKNIQSMNHIHRKLLPIILYVTFNLFFCLSSLLAHNGSQGTATVSMPAFTGAQSFLGWSLFAQKTSLPGMASKDGFYKGVYRRGFTHSPQDSIETAAAPYLSWYAFKHPGGRNNSNTFATTPSDPLYVVAKNQRERIFL